MAFSDDGLHFHKHENNPIILHAPDGQADFRDPKVTKIDGTYYMVVGSGQNGIGSVLLYRSQDLLHWEYVSTLLEDKRYGTAIECPDFFPLSDGYVLMFSQMKRRFRNTVFMYGNFDGANFTPQHVQRPVFGPHYYASQSFCCPTGRRIIIGWLYSWAKRPNKKVDYAGALSIPMELSWQRGHFALMPVNEATHLLRKRRTLLLKDTKTIELFLRGGKTVFCCWYRK